MVLYNVVCVGCGGTGSYFAKEFARFMAVFGRPNMDIALAIVDGDLIEEKNLERQCFMDEDVNSSKALTMAEALKEGFSLENVYAYPNYLDEERQLKVIFTDLYSLASNRRYYSSSVNTVNILIGCVDNHRARQVMEAYYKNENTIIYFDAANEYSNGEVVFAGKNQGKVLGQSRAYYFPDILEDRSKRASEQSCGVINKVEPQHMVTNMLVANLLLAKLIPMIAEGKVSFGIAYFDAFNVFSDFYPYERKGEEPDAENDKKKKGTKKKHQKVHKEVGRGTVSA